MSNESPVLAGPPGDCCFEGFKHTGRPVGETIAIAGVPTYVSHPPSNTPGPKKIVLYFSDIYGPFYLNAELLQDYFASRGFLVLGIDYFLGDPFPANPGPDFDREAWLEKSRKRAREVFPKWVKAVREKYGTKTKYAAVGYCFGGPFAMELAATDDVIASAFAHPAGLNEDHFKNIKKPLMLSCAETDDTFPAASRRRAEDILAEIKATYFLQLFSGVSHGFATRGDPADGDSRWAKEESARGIIEWFIRFTKVKPSCS